MEWGHRVRVLGAVVTVATFAYVPAAKAGDVLIDGARLCTQQFPVAERAHSIPTHLLAAISSTESGRWHQGLGMALPWPWTINVEGQGYYFKTKAEAVAQTAALIRAGKRSIDVGCMQVNLKHHPRAFANLEQAFDPGYNVNYAASFLRTNYNEMNDWIKATAAYHSRTDARGKRYLAAIEKNWNRIVSKVQEARSRQGLGPVAVSNPKFDTQVAMPTKVAGRPTATTQGGKPMQAARTMKIIQVSEGAAPRNEVMVVRQPTQGVIKLADARDTTDEVIVKGVVDAPKAAPAGGSGDTIPVSAPYGAKFVFSN